MKISIVTTVYNQKDYILETIESVQKLVLTPFTDVTWEHLVYDDASTDGTSEILKTTSQPHLRIIYGTENRGPSYGRNILIKEAQGEYIFMIDGDDIILQRTLHNFIKLATDKPDKSWFISDFLRVDQELRYVSGQDYYGWDFKSSKEMLDAIFKGRHFIQSNVFFKKSLFIAVGGFDESMKMTEDLDLFIRFLLTDSLPYFSPFISHLHRMHSNNISKDITIADHIQHVDALRQKYSDRL